MSKTKNSNNTGSTNLAALEQKLRNDNQRNPEGSLEQLKDELRDAYMNFKDLQTRCVIDLKPNSSMVEKEDQTVYYFKPETLLLDDPEKQRRYRENLLKKVSGIPKPDPITYLGDDLHRSMCQSVADRSNPLQSKTILCEFFQKRQYQLQHMKYKLLCRWAHHNMTSENIENMGTEATFMYGKLEFNLEQAIQRHERLEQEDYFDQAYPENRPSTKSEESGSAMYVERFDQLPQSLIREDDIEVYIRGVAHKNKINKLMNKFISRLKWLPLYSKYEIFENAIGDFFDLKNENIKRQNTLVDRIRERAHKTLKMTSELENDLNTVISNYHCKKYEKMFLTGNDRTIHNWRQNHDEVPQFISDQQHLKIAIQDSAQKFNLHGDIEIDNGYTFSYQITVFFPTYFQKQVIKSQFSIYDLDDDIDGNKDPNNVLKRTLNNMTRIDTNIFRDLSTIKSQIPSDEAIQGELKNSDIKVIRLKSSASWIDYIALRPNEPDWHQKQQALLNCENPIDTLMKSGFNFLDVNDLASINHINEDNALLHLKNVQKFAANDQNKQIITKMMQTTDGEKVVKVDKMPQMNSQNVAANLEQHLLNAVQDPIQMQSKEPTQSSQNKQTQSRSNGIYYLPHHQVITYYTLRFMSSRDAKIRILYTLNYFRAIQKRLALDLREFATRDRIEAQISNPYIQSREANQQVVNQATFSSKAYELSQKSQQKEEVISTKNMVVFDEYAISQMNNMANLRQYKNNGIFSNKILSTCPSYPKFHSANGDPVVRQTQDEEQDRQSQKSLSEQSIKLMGRIEFIEINEKSQEVYIKDDFGIYIMYDCVLQDMKCIEDELLKIGSLFLHKSEVLLDPTTTTQNRPQASKDRLQLIDDLLKKEAEFQFWKVKLTQVYMECYEHITDPLEQQKLMQIITDQMARRPRLNLNANYFIDAYDAEIKCLEKQFELAKMLVDMQITLEKTENSRLQDSLNLSFYLANKYSQNKWIYQDAEALLLAIERTQEAKNNTGNTTNKEAKIKESKSQLSPSQINNKEEGKSKENTVENSPDGNNKSSKSQKFEDGFNDTQSDEEEFGSSDQNKFKQLLGLPQITLESIYQGYREKDHNVLKVMSEHSHFIACHEGYPEFLTRLTHRSLMDKNKLFKPNSWSQETGSLDFYETLDFISKFYSITQQMQQELYDGLKLWEPSLMTHIDIQVAEQSMVQLQQVIKMMEGQVEEYKGCALIENEQILGSSDKMIFYAKEMISDLSRKSKLFIDPFLIAKLDLETIKFFEFPKIPQSENKYTVRRTGEVAGAQFLLQTEKHAIAGIAKMKVEDKKYTEVMADLLRGKVTDEVNARNIIVPAQMRIYCNMMELHRLRSEIILASSECSILSQIYLNQCEFIGNKNNKLSQTESINFDKTDLNGQDNVIVNFFDDGPAHMEIIDLAAREFDSNLLSNLNFRHPDAFKINILTAGLEEVRAILLYQILQKHLLIVATRINALLLDTYQRQLSELNLITNKRIAIPNSYINYSQILHRNLDTYNPSLVKSERIKIKQNMTTFCLPLFYSVINKKSQSRTSIAKEFSNYQTIVMQKMPHDDYAVLRVMRCYKLKLLTKFVQQTLTEIYLDAQKIQALQSCQRLRNFGRYFLFDPKQLGMGGQIQQVFRYETNYLNENIPSNYPIDSIGEIEQQTGIGAKKVEPFKPINCYEIQEFFGIPSSATITLLESAPMEDLRKFKQKRLKKRAKLYGTQEENDEIKDIDPLISDPEISLKRIIPTFNPIDWSNHQQKRSLDEIKQLKQKTLGLSGGSFLDYKEAVYFGDSKFASLTRYYVSLERIITLEWFINRLQFRCDEAIHIDNAIESGLPFWKEDSFDQRVSVETKPKPNEVIDNFRSQQFIYEKIISLKQKRNIADVVTSLGLTIKSFISQYQKTKTELRFEYLSQYTEFRFQQIIGSLHKLVQQYYYQKNENAVHTIRSAIAQITKMNHVRLVHLKPNNYSVCSSLLSPNQFILEPGNMIYGSIQHDDVINFKRCIKPVINERALEPSQITLFESMYTFDYLRRSQQTQFAGQFCSTASSIPFKAFESALLDLSHDERVYCQSFIVQTKYQANDFMETVFNDTTMANLTTEEVYNLSQLIDAKKFMNETTQALLLRNALICWYENSTLPASAEKYEQFENNFKQNFFWKQLEKKEEITKKSSITSQFGQIPTKGQLKILSSKIDTLINDQSLATQNQINQRDELVKALREEFNTLKKKVTLDNYFNTKAEVLVFSIEIEKFLIRASIKTLDSECQALAKCFTLQIPKIQYHIHPFQQFAATFYDQCDPNSHLCVSNKINNIQVLLTKIRNRSTEVETLTSGPGIVLTVKDFNDILVDFCKSSIKDQEKQFKSRQELAFLKEENYRQMIYVKDQNIKTLKNRISNIGTNLENIIDARLFERGNQLIYDLDSSNRVLSLFKYEIFGLEKNLVERIQREQSEKFKRQNNLVELKSTKFSAYKESIMNMISADFAEDQERIKAVLKQKAEMAKITGIDSNFSKKIQIYPALSIIQNQGSQMTHEGNGVPQILSGAIVPNGFKHYSNCSCYKPDDRFPKPTMELAELEMYSEAEARSELARLCTLVRRQRVLYRTKEMCMIQKFQEKISILKRQLSDNGYLWEQLAEAQKKERIIKQEMLYTQQNLSAAEKTIQNLKDSIKVIEEEKSRLQNFKSTKVEKLKELEIRVKQIDLTENIDTEKLVNALKAKDTKLNEIQGLQNIFNKRLEYSEIKRESQVNRLQQNLLKEQLKTQSVVDKMEQMKIELKMLETNDSSVGAIWKKKCLDIFEVCQQMKIENDELRNRCKELINQGLTLAEAVSSLDPEKVNNQKLLHHNPSEENVNQQMKFSLYEQQTFIPSTTNSLAQHHSAVKRINNLTPKPQIPVLSQESGRQQMFQSDLGSYSRANGPKDLQQLRNLQQFGFKTQQLGELRSKQIMTQQRNRTIDPCIEGSQAVNPNQSLQNPPIIRHLNDIKSILNGSAVDSVQRRKVVSTDKSRQQKYQLQAKTTGMENGRVSNLIVNSGLNQDHQDSLFNTNNNQLKTELREQSNKKQFRVARQSNAIAFDLQGKSLNTFAKNIQGLKMPAQMNTEHLHRHQQSQGSLNAQALQMRTLESDYQDKTVQNSTNQDQLLSSLRLQNTEKPVIQNEDVSQSFDTKFVQELQSDQQHRQELSD